ncbi:hypothetical protein [Thermoanaerobacter siderophilus]|uniref:Uncharacterized protein n=1 Tax=Thermoanaerobacter siderophilus SR4 TaxID=880478 RepID=I9AD75_9THEO|nr:hypothetical protein [Thermoanaerobacter siderophilus]EIV99956.1 hypothetical protein ThesiDRAFT1_0974 [Thermoanaerobacter siderophilus SR4]
MKFDLSIILGIISILLTILFGIIPLFQKQPWFINIISDNAYVYQTRINIYSSQNIYNKESSYDSDYLYIIVAIIVSFIIVVIYFRFKDIVAAVLSIFNFVGLLISFYILFKKTPQNYIRLRLINILGWLPLIFYSIFLNYPLFQPIDFLQIQNNIINLHGTELSLYIWKIFTKRADISGLIILQFIGLISYPIFYYVNLKYLKLEKLVREYKKYICYLILYFASVNILFSGLILRFWY